MLLTPDKNKRLIHVSNFESKEWINSKSGLIESIESCVKVATQ